jgi:hypothetical protein
MKPYRILKKNIKEKTEDSFVGLYKNHDIHIEREEHGFYITVTGPDGCYCYDGYWINYDYPAPNIDDAIEEALKGSQLI